jgi:hypothetical protein
VVEMKTGLMKLSRSRTLPFPLKPTIVPDFHASIYARRSAFDIRTTPLSLSS